MTDCFVVLVAVSDLRDPAHCTLTKAHLLYIAQVLYTQVTVYSIFIFILIVFYLISYPNCYFIHSSVSFLLSLFLETLVLLLISLRPHTLPDEAPDYRE